MRTLVATTLISLACAADGHLIYDGSSTVFPVIVAAAEAYADVDPRFSMEAKPSGTTAGFRSMIARTCTINGASRPINAKEIKAAAEAGVQFIEVPIAFDALSIVTNPRNTWLKDLTVQELQRLYGKDGPTNWKDVRPGFPNARVVLFGAGSDSGTYDYFKEAIMKERSFRPDITVSEDDHLLVEGVAAEVNAIGYMGLAYLIENSQALRGVAIDNGKGPVPPTKATVLDGSYIPLSRPIFVYVRTDVVSNPQVSGFINFLIDTPSVIDAVGYVSLPAEMRAKIKERFQARITGSLFSGVPAGTPAAQIIGIELGGASAAAPPSAPTSSERATTAAAPAPAPPPTAAATPASAPSPPLVAASAAAPSAAAPTPAAPAIPVAAPTVPAAAAVAPAAAAGVSAVALAAPPPSAPAWQGPSAAAFAEELERLRAASLELARRTLDDRSSLDDIARQAAELQARAAALQEAFRTAPRPAHGALTLADAQALVR
ncbi:MAG: phosphate ABC transporter substrate-binding protein PstS family protein [Burkholderiaceae bacterium]|nr:phosphate ABC transporter substrate-binding protein PstS family protein [Burkholderiaceae bacterium]